jgi:hypothetical protein
MRLLLYQDSARLLLLNGEDYTYLQFLSQEFKHEWHAQAWDNSGHSYSKTIRLPRENRINEELNPKQ